MVDQLILMSKREMLRRWFSFLGGAIAWTFHLLAIYVIGEFGCVSGFDQKAYAGVSAVAWMLIGVSVICLAPAVASALVGYMDARRDESKGISDPFTDGGRYLSRFGWPLNAVFSLIILVESLPVFAYLGGC